ncbi:MAG: radical SAM protein [Thermoplasmatales archaeon]|nr:radical SAM protein [Thermoplasmatales archaeon]
MHSNQLAKRLVKSKYLLKIDIGDNKKALCSNITGSISLIDPEIEDVLESYMEPKSPNESCRGDPECEKVTKELMKRKMLIEESTDEIGIFNDVVEKIRNAGMYAFTFTVTTACNFRCIYCYEEKEPERMVWKVANRCIGFMVEKVEETGQKDVSITFYGGEPLLEFNLIKKILLESRKRLPKNVHISTGLVTNGSLLTEDFAKFLENFDCVSQIPLDGLREVHDKRRAFASGKGSFDEVIGGIKNAIAYLSKVIIRVDVDKTNEKHIPALLDWLKYNNITGHKVRIYFGPVTAITKESEKHARLCIPSYAYGKKLIELTKLAQRKGFVSYFNIPAFLYCRAYRKAQVSFNPKGDIVPCLQRLGKEKEFVVGNVFNDPVYNENANNFFKRSPLDFEKCRKCKIFGFCGGGCISEAYHENGNINTISCPVFKYHFDELVKQYILDNLKYGLEKGEDRKITG